MIEALVKLGLFRPQIISALIQGSPLMVILLVILCFPDIGELKGILQAIRASFVGP